MLSDDTQSASATNEHGLDAAREAEFAEAQQVWGELMAINPQYSMAERLNRSAVQLTQNEMVLYGARKAGLPD